MEPRFETGDFLFYQLEAGFALIRVLGVSEVDGNTVWHFAAYNDLFQDVDSIENAISKPHDLSISIPHVALTNRAFESTQVAEIGNSPITEDEISRLTVWQNDPQRSVADKSIRLLTGLR